MEKLVVIIDHMPEYGERLAKYLNAGRSFPYRAVVCSAMTEVEGYIKNDGVYAVLITEASEAEAIKVLVGTGVKLFRLCETKEEQGSFSFYRYSSVKELERRLLAVDTTKKKTPVIGFFSSVGGSEVEPLAIKIAGELGRKGKVLYVSLFPFGINGRSSGDGLSEVLYFLRQTKGECKERIQGLLQKGEHMDMIGPMQWYTDLRYVTKEDIKSLLQNELWSKDYRAFFVAVGMFDCVGQDILNCCDGVLMPVWETVQGQAAQEEFRRQMKESGETALYSGIREFSVKGFEGTMLEATVKAAVKRGEEIIEGCGGGDSQADAGTVGFIRGTDR